MNNKNNKSKKVLAMLAAATLCSGMLLYVPADTLRVGWSLSASADEIAGDAETASSPVLQLYVDGKQVTGEDGSTDGYTVSDANAGWSYDSATNVLTLENATISQVKFKTGDLVVQLIGENTITNSSSIKKDGANASLTLMGGGILNCQEIECYYSGHGEITIQNVTVNASRIASGGLMTIEDSIVHVTTTTEIIKSGNAIYAESTGDFKGIINAKNSEIIAIGAYKSHGGLFAREKATMENCYIHAESSKEVSTYNDLSGAYNEGFTFINCQVEITKNFDYYTESGMKNTDSIISEKEGVVVYGTVTLHKPMTVTSGKKLLFQEGASITNLDQLTVEDGVSIQENGVVHTHNTDGEVTYTKKDDASHVKTTSCADCPIGYATKAEEAHTFVNGFCTECDAYEPAVQTGEKSYEIGNGGQLYWFADKINAVDMSESTSGLENLHVTLTADIVVNENVLTDGHLSTEGSFREWTPMQGFYNGVFDGNGHTIRGLFAYTQKGSGLFSTVSGSTIRNVGIVDSYFYGANVVGSICGVSLESTLENCYSQSMTVGAIESSMTGGICGFASQGTIRNCYNTGMVIDGGSAGLSGIVERSSNNSIAENCYYLSDDETDDVDGTTAMELERFESGEVAYLLSEGENGTVWGQHIGEESAPVLNGEKVYQNNNYRGCNDTSPVANVFYRNTEGNTFGSHAYENGKCKYCGIFEDGIGANLVGYSLSLGGNIGVNFYMELSDAVVADNGAYMQFTLPNGTVSHVPVSEAKVTEKDGKTYYVFSCDVAAKEMYDTIQAQIITSDKTGAVYRYSVNDYAKYVINEKNGYAENVRNVASAMQNYGTCASAYFVGMSAPAIIELDAVKAELLEDSMALTGGSLPEGVTYCGASLLLESETTLRHYFKAEDGVDMSSYGLKEKDGYYYCEIADIAAGKLAVAKNVRVGKFTILSSPMSYAYTVLSSDTAGENLKDLMKALYLYNQAVEKL